MHQLEKPQSHAEPQLHTIDKALTPVGPMSQVGPIERRNRQQRGIAITRHEDLVALVEVDRRLRARTHGVVRAGGRPRWRR